jgi:UDP-N-acetylglucosamine--N-acetylmuramyl-(pentapeptide) pyrophosphoryl-undecaprenol N-acetylglucosamine transferase
MTKNSAPKNLYIWVVAAGSGGHIFPGLNVVEEIQKTRPQSEFLFFGDAARLEAKIIPSRGFKICFLAAGRWKGSGFLSRMMGLFFVIFGIFQAFKKTFERKPDFLFSVGGYVSVPVAVACYLRKVPIFILEPNIRAGMANRLLSRIAKAVFTTPGSDAGAKMKCPVFEFGNPVRRDFKPIEVHPHVKHILVMGGSQGALSLCRVSLELMRQEVLQKNEIDLFLQTGEKNLDQARLWQDEFDVVPYTTVAPFIQDMPEAIAKADLVIARAGAMTVAELSLSGVPTIFVPFPFAADDHQRVNANILLRAGAAFMADETREGYPAHLFKQVSELCIEAGNFDKRKALNDRFRQWSKPNAARDIFLQIDKVLA